MQEKKQDVVEINEYGLMAFCEKAQELIKQGYEFDLTSNVRAPMSYGTMIVAYMVKDVEPVMVISPPLTEVVVQPETTAVVKADAPTGDDETVVEVELDIPESVVLTKPETTYVDTPGVEVNTTLVAEKQQSEEKVQTEVVTEPKVKAVRKKAGTE
jgi:hypothetical protein